MNGKMKPKLTITWNCILISSILLLSSCSTLLNPYEEDFTCPYIEAGACQSAQAAYQTALHDSEPSSLSKASSSGEVTGFRPTLSHSRIESPSLLGFTRTAPILRLTPVRIEDRASADKAARRTYRTLTYNRLTSLLRAPETPMLAQPEVIRVLLLPRVDDETGSITMSRFRYLIVKPSRWVLEDPFVKEEP